MSRQLAAISSEAARLAQAAREDAVVKLRREGLSHARITKRLHCAENTIAKDCKRLAAKGRLP